MCIRDRYKTIEGLWLDANSAQQRYAAANEKLKSTQISYESVSYTHLLPADW